MTALPIPGQVNPFPNPFKPRRKGLFGSVGQSPMPEMTTAEQPMAPKQNFFGEGGVGRGIAGNIGDFLLQYAGAQPIYQPAMQQQQQMRHQTQQRQLQRAEGLEDWQAKQEWELANKPPVNNDTVADYEFITKTLGPDAGKSYLQNLADGPPVAVDVANPDGSVTRQFMPRSQMQGGGGMVAPQKPVGTLKPYGGQSATPTGTFR